MKRLVILTLLAVLLTGCASKTELRGLINENRTVEEEENIEAPVDTSHAESSTNSEKDLFTKMYKDEESGESIMVYITEKDEHKYISVTYLPSEIDIDTPMLYESKCAGFIAVAFNLLKDEYYDVTVVDNNSYCSVYFGKKGSDEPVSVISNNRDGTPCVNAYDGNVGDWLNVYLKDWSLISETNSVLWIEQVYYQIQKDIEEIYP